MKDLRSDWKQYKANKRYKVNIGVILAGIFPLSFYGGLYWFAASAILNIKGIFILFIVQATTVFIVWYFARAASGNSKEAAKMFFLGSGYAFLMTVLLPSLFIWLWTI